MFWRLILGLALGYLGYRVYRKVAQSLRQGDGSERPREMGEPQVLVQDQVCGTFIPRQEALKLQLDGRDYFFCSEGCLKRFRRRGPNQYPAGN